MYIKSTIGGVSPLKARKSAGKAGKVGKKATATRAQDKSGFSRSDTVDTGKGYKANLESLTAGTRLTNSLVSSLGGTGSGPSLNSAITGKDDFGKTDVFKGSEFKQDPSTKTKIVSTDKDGNPVEKKDQACSKEYIAIHGNADCVAYKKYRDENPVARYARKKVKVEYDTKNGQKYQQDYTTKDGKKTITKPWYKIN